MVVDPEEQNLFFNHPVDHFFDHSGLVIRENFVKVLDVGFGLGFRFFSNQSTTACCASVLSSRRLLMMFFLLM